MVIQGANADGEPVGVDGNKCYVAIKGKVYDVTGNKAYQPGGSYNGMIPYLGELTVKSCG
jgi:predicted heme/steroid binding protein